MATRIMAMRAAIVHKDDIVTEDKDKVGLLEIPNLQSFEQTHNLSIHCQGPCRVFNPTPPLAETAI